MSKNLYLCVSCRNKIPKAEKALFVDQSTSRPFCSEKCILDFHAPHMESFEREEISNKETLGVELNEGLDEYYQHHDIFQNALYAPDEIWFEKNPLGAEYYTHISHLKKDGDEFYYIVICSYFDNEPSFVYFKCVTRSSELTNLYRRKNRKNPQAPVSRPVSEISAEDKLSSLADFQPKSDEIARETPPDEEEEIRIPQQAMDDLDLKKSEYLASLLESRKDEDISFEEFTKYDEFLPLTLEDPDEIYFKEDDRGDETRTYIKSFQAFGKAFFYVVICMKVDIKQLDEQEALLPVISFPSVDQGLYQDYAVGERISSMIKN